MLTKTGIRERPILFSAEMIRAILDGRKTQTRRVIKRQPDGAARFSGCNKPEPYILVDGNPVYLPSVVRCPYGVPGDELWVREAWCPAKLYYDACDIIYAANDARVERYPRSEKEREQAVRAMDKHGWTPSIHMPRWASRLQLAVKSVSVERVQEISLDDEWGEGRPVPLDWNETGRGFDTWFRTLWDKINAKRGYGWDVNPFVWVVKFEVTND